MLKSPSEDRCTEVSEDLEAMVETVEVFEAGIAGKILVLVLADEKVTLLL